LEYEQEQDLAWGDRHLTGGGMGRKLRGMDTTSLPRLPVRMADTHKGDYGKVLVIAGSETMIGAPALAGLAALRTGAGLVRLAVPKEILGAVLTLCPQATGMAWSATKIRELLAYADSQDALVVGPGLGTGGAVKRLVLELLERHHGPMVFDADALNVLSGLETSEWPKRRNWGNIVLTPHMGEYMRLIGAVMKRGANVALGPAAAGLASAAEAAGLAPSGSGKKKAKSMVEEDDAPSTADGVVLELPAEGTAEGTAPAEPAGESAENQETKSESPAAAPAEPDRTPLAELLARGTGTVVVLKGHRTVITDGHTSVVNETGNPAMATAGSGDVLAGVIAALLGQRMAPRDAAVLGVHVHGEAGDLARAAIGANAVGIVSTDIIEKLPAALVGHIGG
jgi:NAD(P)H-hydrate repair Nnr-like enzyme with NAD(P)H-hydrate dehydratase domain